MSSLREIVAVLVMYPMLRQYGVLFRNAGCSTAKLVLPVDNGKGMPHDCSLEGLLQLQVPRGHQLCEHPLDQTMLDALWEPVVLTTLCCEHDGKLKSEAKSQLVPCLCCSICTSDKTCSTVLFCPLTRAMQPL